MYSLETLKENYLSHCKIQKELDAKTVKAYRIDLTQFIAFSSGFDEPFSRENHNRYLTMLHKTYQPKTTKRKIASLKAFFHFLEYEDLLENNPFNKIQLSFREPKRLPKTIPANIIQLFLNTIYRQAQQAPTHGKKKSILRDIALSEQSVRLMINKYAELAGIAMHITPHMFRHSFATLLLEADVDIRYIQKMLGHSSITTTEIYTSVSMHKQKAILTEKHPRNNMEVSGG